ncbi:uncharacterized protein UV8b_02138 [Ustilaginoidea virens]|uniref:Uncharacterized protein n=1 Tax=Ustilaginoidea virens TaxID=1159556 RepID=A0A8E5MFK0_USTVR|nr:uncharacterized protein UV8b_02138 [Ustilaginoidea virens]QUC17897.1 hypothetical protein UV8b_02138 [Ustilaginoidea virens]
MARTLEPARAPDCSILGRCLTLAALVARFLNLPDVGYNAALRRFDHTQQTRHASGPDDFFGSAQSKSSSIRLGTPRRKELYGSSAATFREELPSAHGCMSWAWILGFGLWILDQRLV